MNKKNKYEYKLALIETFETDEGWEYRVKRLDGTMIDEDARFETYATEEEALEYAHDDIDHWVKNDYE